MTITTMPEQAVGAYVVRLQGGGLRFLDTHAVPQNDFQVVTRPSQGSESTQRWRVTDVGGGLSTIQQVSSGRFLEAMVNGDFNVATRSEPSGEQTWRVGDP